MVADLIDFTSKLKTPLSDTPEATDDYVAKFPTEAQQTEMALGRPLEAVVVLSRNDVGQTILFQDGVLDATELVGMLEIMKAIVVHKEMFSD